MQIFNAYVNRSLCGHLHWDLFHEGTMLSSICQTVGLALLFAEVIYQRALTRKKHSRKQFVRTPYY